MDDSRCNVSADDENIFVCFFPSNLVRVYDLEWNYISSHKLELKLGYYNDELRSLGSNRYICGSSDKIIHIFDKKLNFIKTFSTHNWINCIEISKGNILVGCDRGLVQIFDLEGNKIRQFTEPWSRKLHGLWMGSNKHIILYDYSLEQILVYRDESKIARFYYPSGHGHKFGINYVCVDLQDRILLADPSKSTLFVSTIDEQKVIKEIPMQYKGPLELGPLIVTSSSLIITKNKGKEIYVFKN